MSDSSNNQELVVRDADSAGVLRVSDVAMTRDDPLMEGIRLANSTLAVLEHGTDEEKLTHFGKLFPVSMSHAREDYDEQGNRLSRNSLESSIAAKMAILGTFNIQVLTRAKDVTGTSPEDYTVGQEQLDERICDLYDRRCDPSPEPEVKSEKLFASSRLSIAQEKSFASFLRASYGDRDIAWFLDRSAGENSESFVLTRRIKNICDAHQLNHQSLDRGEHNPELLVQSLLHHTRPQSYENATGHPHQETWDVWSNYQRDEMLRTGKIVPRDEKELKKQRLLIIAEDLHSSSRSLPGGHTAHQQELELDLNMSEADEAERKEADKKQAAERGHCLIIPGQRRDRVEEVDEA